MHVPQLALLHQQTGEKREDGFKGRSGAGWHLVVGQVSEGGGWCRDVGEGGLLREVGQVDDVDEEASSDGVHMSRVTTV